VPPRDNRIHSVHDRSGGGRRHRDDCRRERDVFPVLPVAVTVRSYLVFQMAEVAVPRELFGCILDQIARLRLPDPDPC